MRYKRRIKKNEEKQVRQVIIEPNRRSIYDVVITNLKIANRVTFIHRLIYLGEHKFSVLENFTRAMETNYTNTNTGYCTEPLSGILLCYSQHFCYIVEGSEEALHKHLSLLFQSESQNLDNVKLLSPIHHIKSRFWNEWMFYNGRPSERVEEIDPESDLDNSMRYATECCEKMYKFADVFINDQMKIRGRVEEAGDESDEEPAIEVIPLRRTKSLVERDIYSEHLPELKLIRFLTHCKHLKDLKQYHNYYEYIGQSRDYSLKTWPAPKNFVPYNVFDEKYDPITDLPPLAGQEVKYELDEHDTVSMISEVTIKE